MSKTTNFVNFSNHPSIRWEDSQKEAAKLYGNIVDVSFPNIEDGYSCEDIVRLGNEYVTRILEKKPAAVMCQGEFTLTYYVVSQLLSKDVVCLSACTKRIVEERQLPDGSTEKISKFCFIGFREYVK